MHGANSSVCCVSRGRYMLQDTKYNIAMHTYTAVDRINFVRCASSAEEFMLVESNEREKDIYTEIGCEKERRKKEAGHRRQAGRQVCIRQK